uniref:Uncharacterized protein n=1 Tax=Helianthus annuus TaxID=4232 RepID=A0A251TTJ0_HELAN
MASRKKTSGTQFYRRFCFVLDGSNCSLHIVTGEIAGCRNLLLECTKFTYLSKDNSCHQM